MLSELYGGQEYLPCENLCSISTTITPVMFSHSLTDQSHEGFPDSFMFFMPQWEGAPKQGKMLVAEYVGGRLQAGYELVTYESASLQCFFTSETTSSVSLWRSALKIAVCSANVPDLSGVLRV